MHSSGAVALVCLVLAESAAGFSLPGIHSRQGQGLALAGPKTASAGSNAISPGWFASASQPEACFVNGASMRLPMGSKGGAQMCRRSIRLASSPLAMSSDVASANKDVAGELKKMFSASDGTAAFRVEQLNKLKESGVLSKWDSQQLSPRAVSQNELKREIKTELDIDELMGLTAADVDLKGLTLAAFGASAVLGVGGSIIGGETGGAVYWVTYLGASLPLVLIGVGSVAPGIIGDVIGKLKWQFDATNTLERRVRHEAAHMLCGYMCGLPIDGYVVEPEPICQFYDRQDGYADAVEKWQKQRPFSREEIATLSVVSLSGLMGELTKYESADGGQMDLLFLQDVFTRAEGDNFRKANEREGQTRWGAYKARQILEDNKEAFEKLCTAMTAGKSVEECIAVIEA
eukprot:CAMPEP_0173390006 /NCGR_PEP_ID=MMETSP1356-20130122/14238_1 /TAXON_ID=77927 ORGANISM="Hemiselmis virescens, Strain PCC157" /NCGR_SAMPLE_ID=MMETSP1356 /ASSEMBLY_ACC=CAM_ASM_000847 /LENGTH=402 /DNA_ID=CAMNT_0014347311 /DNA_START=48 /DNA_END=1256 /DNA_ORIENTATION=-